MNPNWTFIVRNVLKIETSGFLQMEEENKKFFSVVFWKKYLKKWKRYWNFRENYMFGIFFNDHFWGYFWATWLWFWAHNWPPNLWISLSDILKWCHSLCDHLKISFNEIHRLGTNACTQNHYRLTKKWSQNWLNSKIPKICISSAPSCGFLLITLPIANGFYSSMSWNDPWDLP